MKLLKKNNKPVTQENQYLLQEIALTKRALSAAYSNFDNATDPDLIDCYIYQVNSEQKRYKYLLQKAKEYEKINRKLTKEELTALCRRMEKHAQKFREYMRMVEEEREKAERKKNQK